MNEIYNHNLEKLLSTAGLATQFATDSRADSQLAAAWGIASKWNEASRYALWDSFTAANLISAIADKDHGVLQWVKKHW